MTNEEMNAKAQQIADLVTNSLQSGETADDVSRLVFVNVKAMLATLADQLGKIPALEATAKAVTDTDLAHKATQAELSTAHQKISDLEHHVVRCRNAGAELQRQLDDLTKRNANLEKAAEVASVKNG